MLRRNNIISVRIYVTVCILSLVSIFYTNKAFAEERWDLLTIESIKCVKPAGGIDSAILDAFKYVEDIGGYLKDVDVPVYSDIAGAAKKGSSEAKKALKYLDGKSSGQDDLIVRVNGKKVLPIKGTYVAMKAGQLIKPNIRFSFKNKVRISLVEWDSGSDNDDLGNVTIDSSKMKMNEVRQWKKLVVVAPSSEDGSIYYITARVDEGKGDPNSVAQWVKCGTGVCIECSQVQCAEHKRDGLDRDGDKSDLKSCPPGYKHFSYQKFPQWIAEDVYLRICALDSWDAHNIVWHKVGYPHSARKIAACSDGSLLAMNADKGFYMNKKRGVDDGWSKINTLPSNAKNIACGPGNVAYFQTSDRNLWRVDGLNNFSKVGKPHSAAEVSGSGTELWALNDDKKLYRNLHRGGDRYWKQVGYPHSASKIAAAKSVVFALNIDKTLWLNRAGGGDRSWKYLGKRLTAIELAAAPGKGSVSAFLYVLDKDYVLWEGEVIGQ